ncbi:hypothetical protein SGODD07_00212 [Streptococcus gordonii]|uniref:Uncharacterized protein n=1 Tax=Streptococcus gordonii TaxID=1302 RepID=A0A139NEE5_STRGN|nr:hypothetical protein SGODD07_00212 [Streptococcus gordonii]
MEGVSTWCQVQFFRLTCFRCPVFYCISFCLIALVNLDLSARDFFSTKVYFTESNSFGTVIVFIGYSYFRTISYDLVVFTFRVFLSNIRHFHCTVSFDLESDVSHLEVTCWSYFLMEGVSTWCQVEIFRLTSFRCPAFYSCAFCLVALVDLDLSARDFCTTKVYFTESNSFGTVIVFISNSQNWTSYKNSIISSLILNSDRTVSINCKSNISYNLISLWSIELS